MAKKKVKRITVNRKLSAEERELIQNTSLFRSALLQKLTGTTRDIDGECGYPTSITAQDYHNQYERNGIAARVVDVWPEESWAVPPDIIEDESPDVETEFEKAWKELDKKLHLLSFLSRADKLSGVGRFGVLLLGVDDGLDLSEPIEGVSETGEMTRTSVERNLIYLRAFDESVVTIKATEQDPTNPRYGQPTIYSVDFTSGTDTSIITSTQVHWTRIIHLADNRQMSEIYGVPRMKKTYNRLLDVHKILSGSGEMYWKGAFPGYSFEVEGDDGTVELDKTSLREEMENYMNGLQRYLALTGVSVKSLAPQVADPSGHLQAQMDAIAFALGIPKRILFGSEQAQLASGQDAKTWNKRVKRRQEEYVTPMVIRPFVDRLIAIGVLPEPVEYQVVWTDLQSLTEAERAEIAEKWAVALSKYVAGNVEAVLAPDEFFGLFGGLEPEQIQQIQKGLEGFLAEHPPEPEPVPEPIPPQGA